MQEVISIKELVGSVTKRWKLILIVTILVTAAAWGISNYAIKPVYKSGVKVFVGKEGSEASYNNGDVYMYQNLLKTFAELIKTEQLVHNAIIGHPISGTSKEILPKLSVIPREDTQIIQISYTSVNKEETEKIVTLVADEFIKEAKGIIPNSNVHIIEKARVPGGPISPNVRQNTVIAFLLAIMGSVGVCLLLEFMDNTIKSTKDIEEIVGISILGTISIDEVLPEEKISGRKLAKKNKKDSRVIKEKSKQNKETAKKEKAVAKEKKNNDKKEQKEKKKRSRRERKTYDTNATESQ